MLRGRSKPPFSSLRRNLMYVPGMPGAHLQSTETDVLLINQPIGLTAENDEKALQLKDELASWLITDNPVPLEFEDEPGRIYYAVVVNTIEDFERFAISRRGTIQFLCPDPFGYGQELNANFPSDSVALTNHGTAEADPIFEFEVLQPITFAMIQNGSTDDEHVTGDVQYQMIGRPSDDEVEVVDAKVSVLYENGSTIDEWNNASIDMVDINVDSVDGVMGTDGAGIRPDDYGTPRERQRGPAVFKELPEGIQDFEIESTFDIISRRESENWRMVIYLHDENMNSIGHIGLKDNSRLYKRRVPLGRVGPHIGDDPDGISILGDASWHNDNARDTTLFYLRMKREGQQFSFYVGEWQNQKHINVWDGVHRDVNNEWQGKLKYITLFIGSYQDRGTPSRLRMNSVEVFELKSIVEDQTPYIAYPGDVITFDHKDDELLINGENRTDIKDFGGRFFKLKKGTNELHVLPEGAFDVSARYRERFR